MTSDLLAILGPTAIGKTAVGIEIAKRIHAEIISADSRQVFRRLTIGTAKPTQHELDQIPHHFIDERDLDEPYSAGTFATDARKRIEDIRARDRKAVIVGGSTLYYHALLEGVAEIPAVNEANRSRTEKEHSAIGSQAQFELLQSIDPIAAATVDASKTQRVQRMLSVYYQTGNPISHYWQTSEASPLPCFKIALKMDRELLYKRIDQRVESMIGNGLISELESLITSGYTEETEALQTIGYRECFPFLRGTIDLDETKRLIARNTRRYAKRQMTWLRRYDDIVWIEVVPEDDAAEIAEYILEKVG